MFFLRPKPILKRKVNNMEEKAIEVPTRKQIAFDLHQAALKVYYPKPKLSLNKQFYKKPIGILQNLWGNMASRANNIPFMLHKKK